jgi:hypothetical protein
LLKYQSSSSSSCTGIGLPVVLILGATGAEGAANGAEGVNAPAEGAAGLLKLKFVLPILALAENPPLPRLGLGVLGLGEPPLLAAFNASILASLSPPANIIPDKVPVKNVAIGMISSKNF